MVARSISLHALSGIPLVVPGDDIGKIIADSLDINQLELADGDVIVVAQKIISKAEGRYRNLADVTPSKDALDIAKAVAKDPRLVELILQESVDIVRQAPGVLIVENRLGIVHANAGIDRSNIPAEADGDGENVLLLPIDPDASAKSLRQFMASKWGADVAVIINDSTGRAWRNGTTGIAIGVAGIPAIIDMRGTPDLFKRPMETTEIGFADELASAASLLMGQADEGSPVVIIKGLHPKQDDQGVKPLLRSRERDLFR